MRTFLANQLCLNLVLVMLSSTCYADVLDPIDFSSLGTLNFSSGSITIDTDALTISGSASFNGVADNQGGMADSFGGVAGPLGIPEVAVFTFDNISLTGTTSITVTGTRALALLSHGDVTIDVTLAVNGAGDGVEVVAGSTNVGGPGGFAGGVGADDGAGPGGGGYSESFDAFASVSAASGGFGSDGLNGQGGGGGSTVGVAGVAYGDLSSALQGGSGGGGVAFLVDPVSQHRIAGGGGGGGALEVGAIGTVTVGPSGVLDASGGIGDWAFLLAETDAGSGSGGGIRIHGAQFASQGVIRAKGGDSAPFALVPSGGGGRVLVSNPLGITQVVGDPLNFDPTAFGIDVSGGDGFGARVHGVVVMTPQLTIVPGGQTYELGSIAVLQNASTTQPEVNFIARSVQATGNGELTVASGGHTNEFSIDLLNPFTSITGTGTLTNTAELRGTGSVEVAVVNSTGGEINTINDTLVFTQAVINNAGGQINAINSTLQFDSGLTNNGEMNLINSNIVGSVTSTVTSAATLVGSNSVSLDYTMAAGDTLFMDLGGTLPSQFDTLTVGGDVTLAGSLNVTFDGYTPSAGDTFEIITATTVLNEFGTVNLPALPGGLLWFVNYGATSVELVSTYGADFDEDGDVDDLDLAAWESNFGSTSATHMTGDANTDTAADGSDFLAWQRQFGNTAPAIAATATIPEPSSLLLAALGLLALSVRLEKGVGSLRSLRRPFCLALDADTFLSTDQESPLNTERVLINNRSCAEVPRTIRVKRQLLATPR